MITCAKQLDQQRIGANEIHGSYRAQVDKYMFTEKLETKPVWCWSCPNDL